MLTPPARPTTPNAIPVRRILAYCNASQWSQGRCLRGICEFGRAHGWNVIYGRSESSFAHMHASGARFDGVILSTVEESEVRAAHEMSKYVVGMDSAETKWFAASANPDDLAIGEMAAQHLLERGFRTLAVIPHPLGYAYGERRVAGFRRAALRAGVPVHVFRHASDGARFVASRVADWLVRKGRPCAAFAIDDQTAAQTIHQCVYAGYRIPDDVAVLGAENIDEAQLVVLRPLSSVDVPFEQVGFRAAELLDRLMNGQTPSVPEVLVPPTAVVVRESTDALALEDPLLARAYTYIRQHLAEGVRVSDLERSLHVSRRQLERRTAAGWGCGPLEMIQRMRIEEAKHLLAKTNRTMEDIAGAAGFSAARSFLKQFKRLVCQTPSEFRAQHRARP